MDFEEIMHLYGYSVAPSNPNVNGGNEIRVEEGEGGAVHVLQNPNPRWVEPRIE